MQLISGFSKFLRTGWQRPALPALAAALIAFSSPQAIGQSLFSPAIRINQDIVTWYELQQRQQFLEALGLPGSSEDEVREALIDARLRKQAMRDAGIQATPEDVQLGIDQFAARGQLSTEDFLRLLSDAGVDPETVRDFVEDQLSWRDYVSTRFISQARPTEDEINRAMGQGGGGGLEVLLSEIIIPVTPQTLAQADALAQEISQVDGYDAFSSAATQYSAAATRENGGRLDWLSLNNLPPALQPVILGLRNGDVTEPLSLPNAIALFQMRGIREGIGAAPRYSAIEYAVYQVPGGRTPEGQAAAQKVVDAVDTCDDFYGLAQGQDPAVLDIHSHTPAEIPNDIALELAKLDPGETSIALTRNNGQSRLVLMLCGRTADVGEDRSRETVANALTTQRLTSLVESYLAQLRADARIDIK